MTGNPDKIPEFLLEFRDRKLLAGFSGGGDSTALLLLLTRWGWRGNRLEAVHFEHGLRGEASRCDATWCEAFCRDRHIAFCRVDLGLPPGPNLEARARRARLDYWQSRAPAVVALGHHADDADETLLLRLARGGNASSLAGLRSVRKLGGVVLLRPLLDWRKEELADFLRQEGVAEWRTDATNADDVFDRNYVRHRLLEPWFEARPRVRSGLNRARRALAVDADFLEQCTRNMLAELPRSAITPAIFWKKLHPALQIRVLRAYLERETRANVTLPHAAWVRFGTEVMKKHNNACEFSLGAAIRFRLRQGFLELLVSEKTTGLPDEIRWDWHIRPEVEHDGWRWRAELRSSLPPEGCSDFCFCFDASRFPTVLTLGRRRTGEWMNILGEPCPRQVKHLITNAGLPLRPVVLRDSGGSVLAVAGVRRGAAFPVTPESNAIVCIEAEPCGPASK